MIFNYGFLCSNAHFQYQIPFFEEREFQILIHDYRCHFSSSGIEDIDSCNFKNISNDLFELIFFIGFEKNIMIGHSMGVNI
ncbi:MAG: alpha/beta hydrolase, partial [Halobacteriovoraceae bacterium]|nr:alpha/beta hydrolase [Halobacteriovoraceae bacterium]